MAQTKVKTHITLRELAVNILAKPDLDSPVEFMVINADTGALICCDLQGPSTTDLIRILAKRGRGRAKIE